MMNRVEQDRPSHQGRVIVDKVQLLPIVTDNRNNNNHERDMRLIGNLQYRLQAMETELVKMKAEQGKWKMDHRNHGTSSQKVLEYLNRVEAGKFDTEEQLKELHQKMEFIQRELSRSNLVSHEKSANTDYHLDRLQLASKLTSSRTTVQTDLLSQNVKSAMTKTSNLENMVQQLTAELQLIKQESKEKNNDLEIASRSAFEKMNRMHQLIAQKEKQLAEKITQVQENIELIEAMERENGERRYRLVEKKSDMVKEAAERRVDLAEHGIVRERRERILAEDKLRKEIHTKWESFESSLREHESLLAANNNRFLQMTNDMIGKHDHKLNEFSLQFDRVVANLAKRIENINKSTGNAKRDMETVIQKATKRIEELLKAEVKVRSSSLRKIKTDMDEFYQVMKDELTQVRTKEEAKLILLTTKMEQAMERVDSMESDLRQEMGDHFDALEQRQQSRDQSVNVAMEQTRNRVNDLAKDMQNQNVSLNKKIDGINETLSNKIQALELSTSNAMAKLDGQISRQLEDLRKDLCKQIQEEKLERVDDASRSKQHLGEKILNVEQALLQKVHNIQHDVAHHHSENKQLLESTRLALVQDLTATKSQLQSGIQQLRNVQIETNERLGKQIHDNHKSQMQELQHQTQRMGQMHEELTLTDNNMETKLKHHTTMLQGLIQRAMERTGEIADEIQLEMKRAMETEAKLRDTMEQSTFSLQNMQSEMIQQAHDSFHKQIAQNSSKVTAYVDHKTSVLKSVCKSSIEKEVASRMNSIRDTRQDLQNLIQIQKDMMETYTHEQLNAFKHKLEWKLSEESEKRKKADGNVKLQMEQKIQESESKIREEQEMKHIMNALTQRVVDDHHEAQHQRLEKLGAQNIDNMERQIVAKLDEQLLESLQRIEKVEGTTKSVIAELQDQLRNERHETNEKLQIASADATKTAISTLLDSLCDQIVQQDLEQKNAALGSNLSKTQQRIEADLGRVKQDHQEMLDILANTQTEAMNRKVDTEVASCLDGMIQSIAIEQAQQDLQDALEETNTAMNAKVDNILQDQKTQLDDARKEFQQYALEVKNELLQDLNELKTEQVKLAEMVSIINSNDANNDAQTMKAELAKLIESEKQLMAKTNELEERGNKLEEALAVVQNMDNSLQDLDQVRKDLEDLKRKESHDMRTLLEQNEKLESKEKALEEQVENLKQLEEELVDEIHEIKETEELLEDALLVVGKENLKALQEQQHLKQDISDLQESKEKMQEAILVVGHENLKARVDQHIEENPNEEQEEKQM